MSQTRIEDRTFARDRVSAADAVRLSGHELASCFFDNCTLAPGCSLAERPTVHSVVLENARYSNCHVFGAVFDSCEFRDLKSFGTSPLFLNGVAFRHVILRGGVSSFKLLPTPSICVDESLKQRWVSANRKFYSTVDWAIDISRAKSKFSPDLHFVPGELVVRNPETQVLVRRQAIASIDLQNLDWHGSAFDIALEWFLDDGPYDSVVLAARSNPKYRKSDLAALEMLRNKGLAE